jgi:hypothetical protein
MVKERAIPSSLAFCETNEKGQKGQTLFTLLNSGEEGNEPPHAPALKAGEEE